MNFWIQGYDAHFISLDINNHSLPVKIKTQLTIYLNLIYLFIYLIYYQLLLLSVIFIIIIHYLLLSIIYLVNIF